jgi:uncharacterized membrane protein
MPSEKIKSIGRIEPARAPTFVAMKMALHFLLTLAAYAAFDLAWLNLFAKNFVRRQVGHYLAERPDLTAAAIFYLIFTFGILYFCVYPAESAGRALFNGALFGLVTYATYELVNRALIAQWPWTLVVVDIAWGVFAGAMATWVSFKIKNWLSML